MNWMFPYAVGTTTTTVGPDTAGNAAPFDPYCLSSPSSDQQEAESVSSPSPSAAASFSSSSSSTDHLTFITPTQRSSPSASPLCFGAGKLLWRSNAGGARAHVPNKKQQEESANAAPKGDLVTRYLRKISRRLRKARAVNKDSPPPPCRAAVVVVDDTARERAEAVASAVAYCKESLRRGRSTALRPVSSPSLDCWLQGWHEEVIAAAHCNDECTDSPPPPPPLCQAADMQCEESSLPPSSPSPGDVSPRHGHDTGDKSSDKAAAAEETAKLSSPSDSLHREFSISDGFNEIEFLKTCSGEDEIIGLHFITIRI
ncbi:hypothetical protein QOZ80_6AG0548870 [Eleusine coracana subsp. coracana]|nr:hypothetical protein QOZ80_6AG0548870 [Eleusine coracana subsp. coracana]